MQIKELTNKISPKWDDYVRYHPEGTYCHLSGWKNVIEQTFGHPCRYIYAQKDNQILGILPLVIMTSRLFGSFLISVPFLNYGGILANDPEIEEQLKKEAIRIAMENSLEFIEFRHARKKELNLPNKQHKVAMMLQLPEDTEILWKSLKAKVRNLVRKAERNDLYVKSGRQESLDDFYYIFATNMRDLGTPVYPKAFFENILNEFESARIFVVHNEYVPVAAGFTMGLNGKLDIPWASSIKEFNYLNGNMLLYWQILKTACESGYDIFDFGRCTPDESHFRFKKQWGALPVQLNWQYWLPNGQDLPEISPHNTKYRFLIATWKRLPLALTNRIGPKIVKNIP